MDVCLGRRGEYPSHSIYKRLLIKKNPVLRDVKERGRDIDGIIKQWFDFVKPSYKKFVEPQRSVSGMYASLRDQDLCKDILFNSS
jgi:uridine kinase